MEILDKLSNRKNLLAFSAGVDSSALFFLLLEHNIKFDIALVNYGLRQQSEAEEAYALALSKEYNLKAHIKKAPAFTNNFEKNARDFRYAFFDELMVEHGYDNLLTAHQLNDQLEWFLMRLTKGAGVSELMGLESYSKRQGYALVRPVLEYSKQELQAYLDANNHHYFIDESNLDEKYERNYFRNEFANKLVEEYGQGLKNSFKYLKKDKLVLSQGIQELFNEKAFYVISYEDEASIVRVVDRYLKKLGYLLSSAQRNELKKENSLVFGGVWAVEIQEREKRIYIAPYRTTVMPKVFKEACRKVKIPVKVRSYLFEEKITFKGL